MHEPPPSLDVLVVEDDRQLSEMLLQKPFTRATLLATVEQVLGEGQPV